MAKIKLNISRTFEETFHDFLISRKAKGLADKTLKSYQTHFQAISKHMDVSKSMALLQKSDIDKMILSSIPKGKRKGRSI